MTGMLSKEIAEAGVALAAALDQLAPALEKAADKAKRLLEAWADAGAQLEETGSLPEEMRSILTDAFAEAGAASSVYTTAILTVGAAQQLIFARLDEAAIR